MVEAALFLGLLDQDKTIEYGDGLKVDSYYQALGCLRWLMVRLKPRLDDSGFNSKFVDDILMNSPTVTTQLCQVINLSHNRLTVLPNDFPRTAGLGIP